MAIADTPSFRSMGLTQANFTGNVAYSLLDVNVDGIAEALVASVEVDIMVAGTYSVDGYLMNGGTLVSARPSWNTMIPTLGRRFRAILGYTPSNFNSLGRIASNRGWTDHMSWSSPYAVPRPLGIRSKASHLLTGAASSANSLQRLRLPQTRVRMSMPTASSMPYALW